MTINLPPTKPPAEVHPMQALLDQGGYDMPQRGDIREGTILSVSPQEVVIDLGLKREGIVRATIWPGSTKTSSRRSRQARPGRSTSCSRPTGKGT